MNRHGSWFKARNFIIMKTINPKTVILASEAARRLSVSVDAVRRYGDEGILRVVRTSGGVRLFDSRDVERFDEQRDTAKRS